MKFNLAEIRSNPFRDIEHYPIDRPKIEALKTSIESTGFWDNVVARRVGKQAEIAYGHHRMVALRELLPDDAEVELIVRDLDDAAMLRIMADENMQEWTSSAEIEQETIAAVVKAYADGKIQLDRPNGRTRDQLRYAPHFRLVRTDGAVTDRPYSADTVASFLRWPIGKVQRALTALAAIEDADVPEETFRGIGSTLAERIVQASRSAQRRAKATGSDDARAKEVGRQVATQLADEFRGEGYAIGTALTDRRERMIDEIIPRVETPKLPRDIAEALYREIEGFWRKGVAIPGQGTFTRSEVLRLIAANRDAVELRGSVLPWNEQLASALNEMSQTALELADVLLAEDAAVPA